MDRPARRTRSGASGTEDEREVDDRFGRGCLVIGLVATAAFAVAVLLRMGVS